MPTDPNVIDLDELDELNPPERTFRVAGRALVLRELPHAEYFRAARVAGAIQEKVVVGEFAVGEIESANKRLLLMLYGPANPWLAEFDERAYQDALGKRLDQVAAWRQANDLPETELALDEFPEPKRDDFAGTFFDGVSPRKLAYLSTEALKLGMPVLDEGALEAPGVPPELAAARAAMENRMRVQNGSAGGRRTKR